jgi:hypothetical protein
MSFTFPSIFKPSHQPEAPTPMGVREFELPLDHMDDIRLLPYDKAIGDLAGKALLLSGIEILQKEFGVTDSDLARQRVVGLANDISALGSDVVHAHEPFLVDMNVDEGDIIDKTSYRLATLKENTQTKPAIKARFDAKLEPVKVLPEGVKSEKELVDHQIEDLWRQKALQGEDAALTLLSIKKLANTPDQGFYAARAADVLSNIHADDTRIALK